MANNQVMIKKLQRVLNMKGQRILYSTSQFYSADQDRAITIHNIKQAVYNENTGKFDNEELFSTTSQIQVVLFLRDLLYELEGREIPLDNETWNEAKRKYYDRKNKQNS